MSRCVEETSTTISNLRALQQKLDQQLNEDINEKMYWKRKCELLGEFNLMFHARNMFLCFFLVAHIFGFFNMKSCLTWDNNYWAVPT